MGTIVRFEEGNSCSEQRGITKSNEENREREKRGGGSLFECVCVCVQEKEKAMQAIREGECVRAIQHVPVRCVCVSVGWRNWGWGPVKCR